MSVQEFKMELEVSYEVFFDKEAQNNYGFGIYSCKPVNHTRELATDYQGKVSIQGTSRRLAQGERYDIKFNGTYTHAKHGDFYKIVEVAAPQLNTVDDQDRFLKAIITEAQLNSLKNAYPNTLLVDLILEGKVDTKKTKGIKAKSLAGITLKVKQNTHISVLIAKLNELGLSTNAINKLLAHFETSEKVLQVIEENIYKLCQVKSFGFKTIDQIAILRGDNPSNQSRITACLVYLLKEDNSEGHTWSNKVTLIDMSVELLNIDRSHIEEALNKGVKSKLFYIDENKVARSIVREQEVEIYRHLKRISESYITVNNITEKMANKIKLVEEQQGFTFTEQQHNMIVEGASHGVITINGSAGSGKTASVKGLIDSLGASSYQTCALSGKAVNVLSQRGIEASTIHRMLKYTFGVFEHNEKNPLPFDVLVVDEMSMVDVQLFLSILRAIENGTKLVLVGDSAQLSCIGYGNILYDLLNTKMFPSFELTQVHRQAKKSGILLLANSIRNGNQAMPYNSSGKETYGELQDQTVIGYADKNSIPYDIIKIAQGYKNKIKQAEDLLEFQILVSNRERGNLSVRGLNIELQKVFNDLRKPALDRNNYGYRAGDKIIAQGNNYNLHSYTDTKEFVTQSKHYLDNEIEGKINVYNGTMGLIKSTYKNHALIQFEGIDGLIAVAQGDMDKIDMAYAITVHKSQGSSYMDTIFALDFGAYSLLSRGLVYTALTRASRKGLVLAETNALFTAINNDTSGNRQTFLADIINNNTVK